MYNIVYIYTYINQIPATIHIGVTVIQEKTPKPIATAKN